VNHTILTKPLSLQKNLDGDQYLQDDIGTVFGIMDSDCIRMYNSDDGHIVHKIKEIESISLKDDACIVVKTDGSIHEHKKKIQADESINPYEILDYTKTDINNTLKVFKHVFPTWKEYLYRDVLDGRIHINPAMFGGKDEFKPYRGNGSDLIQILDILCQQTNTITENGKTRTIRFNPKKETLADAIDKLAYDNQRNSFIYRIRQVKWDGKERIDLFLWNIGCRAGLTEGYEEELYLRFVSRGIFLVPIDRCLEESIRSIPFMPVIVGEQGTGKSDLCKWLGMDWYRGTITEMSKEKTFYESSSGSVILELIEGAQFDNTSIEIMKAMVEKDRLQFRGSYEKYEQTIPIRFLMIATTNDMLPLKDGSGNRRFYPIIKTRDGIREIEDYTEDEILQLWAEALYLYENGSRWDDDLLDPEMDKIFKKMQAKATSYPAPFGDLKDWLDLAYGKVGDRVSNRQIRDFLQEKGWYGKDSDKALSIFTRRYAMGIGFKPIGSTWWDDGERSRGFERVK